MQLGAGSTADLVDECAGFANDAADHVYGYSNDARLDFALDRCAGECLAVCRARGRGVGRRVTAFRQRRGVVKDDTSDFLKVFVDAQTNIVDG